MMPSPEQFEQLYLLSVQVFYFVVSTRNEGDGHDGLQPEIYAHHEILRFTYLGRLKMSLAALFMPLVRKVQVDG